VLRAAAAHQGTALVEIYQNCNIFNDGAFELLKDSDTKGDWIIPLEHGEPIRFGTDGSKAVIRDAATGALRVAENVAADDARVVVHDAHAEDPSYGFALSRLSQSDTRLSPMGIFRSVERPTYDEQLIAQVEAAKAQDSGDLESLQALLNGSDMWSVS
jgi:2-oxoglutarate ferredoxin oxidoreductase subunit beta